MLSELGQTQKNKHCATAFVRGLGQSESQRSHVEWQHEAWVSGEGGSIQGVQSVSFVQCWWLCNKARTPNAATFYA